MTKTKYEISLRDCLRNQYKNKIIKFDDNKKASLTHYIYSSKNSYLKDSCRITATNYVQEILSYKYPQDKISYKVAEKALQGLLFDFQEHIPFPKPKNPRFEFIDLFAGIGGFRIALQNLGGLCVFSSEWDEKAKKTYEANFGEVPFGDITQSDTKKFIPSDFDVLCAGFPCQAFSIAGKRSGFEDTRGTLFFDVAEIIKLII